MTDNTAAQRCPICQDDFTAPELARISRHNYNNGVKCCRCRNWFHFFCLKNHFQHLDDGKETCPLCRQEIPILHPESSFIKLQKFTNQLLADLIKRRRQDTTARLTAVAEQGANLDPSADIQRIVDELRAAVQAEAKEVTVSSFHPPLLTARALSKPMYKAAERLIDLDPSTLSGRNPLTNLQTDVFFEFDQITTRLREALDSGEEDEEDEEDSDRQSTEELDEEDEEESDRQSTEELDEEDEEDEEDGGDADRQSTEEYNSEEEDN